MRERHLPLRTCVVCGRKGPKEGLVRIVATNVGVAPDLGGKAPGRGAYVCKVGGCTGMGLQRKRLEHSLRTELSDPQWSEIISWIGALSPIDRSDDRPSSDKVSGKIDD